MNLGTSQQRDAVQMQESRISWFGKALRFILPILATLPVVYNAGLRNTPEYYVDEVYWLGSTYYYHLALIECDWSHTDWQLLPARENPPLGKYMMGAFLHANGRSVKTPDLLGSFYLMCYAFPDAWGKDSTAFNKRAAVAERVDRAQAEAILRGEPASVDFNDIRILRLLMVILGGLASMGI